MSEFLQVSQHRALGCSQGWAQFSVEIKAVLFSC